MDEVIFWPALHSAWSGFDLIPHRQFARVFKDYKDSWSENHLAPEDASTYKALPDNITVFRGQDATAKVGLSWTLDRKVAEEFARGHRGIFNRNPVVIEAVVSKADIAGVYGERGESEIVLFSATAAKRRRMVPYQVEPRSNYL